MSESRSRAPRGVIGVGLQPQDGDCGTSDGDGLQGRESLIAGDGDVLGGAAGGKASVGGADPYLVPPCPKRRGGRALNGEDDREEFSLDTPAPGAVFIVLILFPLGEDFGEVRSGGG